MRVALDYLGQNPVFHMNMIDLLTHGEARLLYASPGGVLIRENESGAYMMSADDAGQARAMLDLVEHCDTFVCHQRDYMDMAREKFSLKAALDCVACAYMGTAPARFDGLYAVRPLTMEHLAAVRAHYRNVDSEKYMVGRIQAGCMWGAFEGDTLMGFIGQHAEKSIGMLEVLPAYRRRRVGAELEGYLINRLLQKGRVPFCQVFQENEASVLLQRAVGMTVSREHMYWLC